MARQGWQYLALFLTFLSSSRAASPTSFCKCTCFTNSTIIPLDAPSSDDNSASKDQAAHHSRTCADCTKQFCLDYNLPICEKATESDVFTTCFQRDSTKDELVVFIFIFATVGLLAWALVKPYVGKWKERRQGVGVGGAAQRGEYAPVSGAVGR